jgi:hypothetical protein
VPVVVGFAVSLVLSVGRWGVAGGADGQSTLHFRAYFAGILVFTSSPHLERLDVKGKIVTGDAIFCQKSITAKIVGRGGDYVLPVKDNQKALRQDIETAFNEPVSGCSARSPLRGPS